LADVDHASPLFAASPRRSDYVRAPLLGRCDVEKIREIPARWPGAMRLLLLGGGSIALWALIEMALRGF
jgi:hypothetical protein